MEELSKLLLEERAHSEQFKVNFIHLKAEYDKLLTENQRLCEEIGRKNAEHPDEVLKRKLKNVEKQLHEKEYLLRSLQEKVHVLDETLREKVHQEEVYASKFVATEIALEQTKSLLARLQLDASALASNIEQKHNKEEFNHKREILELAEKFSRSEKEKNMIAQQVIKATTKAQNKMELLRQENNLLAFSISKLKESLDKVNWEKSELSSQLETIKVQQGQERGELMAQIRNQECELTNLQAKIQALEQSYQGVLRDKEMNGLALQAAEKDLVKLRGSLYEMEVKYNSSADHSRKELDAAEHRHKLEIDALHKTLHGMRMDFEQERDRIQSQSDKLLQHEKQLAVAQEELRKKELEVSSRVQEIKIETEDKYRAMLEEKFKAEIETARRSAEVESQLILERHLKANLEVEHRRLLNEIQGLTERLQSTGDFPADKKRLEVAVELKEMEKNQLKEKYDLLVKEKELAASQHQAAEANMTREMAALKGQVEELQQRLATAEAEAKNKIRQMEHSLKTTEEKSHRYARLIWKLRERLAGGKGGHDSLQRKFTID